MPISRTVLQIHRLQHIQKQLQEQSSRSLIPQRYDWIESRLAEILPGAADFFQSQEALDRADQKLLATKKELNSTVRRLSAGYLLLCRGVIKLAGSEKDVEKFSSGQDVIQRARSLTAWIEGQSEHFQSLIDARLIDTQLLDGKSSALHACKVEIAKIASEKDATSADFLKREDEIDDLYHEISNVLEGLFHEDEGLLKIFLPHRGRRDG